MAHRNPLLGITQTVALFANSVWVFSIKKYFNVNNLMQKHRLFYYEKYPMTIPAFDFVTKNNTHEIIANAVKQSA